MFRGYLSFRECKLILVGGWTNPIEKYIGSSNWFTSPGRVENNKCLKPPPSIPLKTVGKNTSSTWDLIDPSPTSLIMVLKGRLESILIPMKKILGTSQVHWLPMGPLLYGHIGSGSNIFFCAPELSLRQQLPSSCHRLIRETHQAIV